MHEIESELLDFCSQDWSQKLISLLKKHNSGFSVKSNENEHLWIAYENAYIGLHWHNEPHISFATSGDDNVSDSKRFQQDEVVFSRLLHDLKIIKK